MDIKDLHKHFDHIIKNSKKLKGDDIVLYIHHISEKIHIPFGDIIEEFTYYWDNMNKKRKI